MGWWTYNCNCCKRPISDGRVGLKDVVLISKDMVAEGELDDYGRLYTNDAEINLLNIEEFNIYHKTCWKLAKKPLKYNGTKAKMRQ